MKRIEMDFNTVREDGRFRVSEVAASEPLVVGIGCSASIAMRRGWNSREW